MELSEEEIRRLEQHIDRYDTPQDPFKEVEGFENLQVETNGESYRFSYGGAESSYRVKDGAKELFAGFLDLMADDMAFGTALYLSDYSHGSSGQVRGFVRDFMDDEDCLVEELRDDFSKLADEILD